MRPEYYQGLGYVPRNEVAKISKLIREYTPANLPIHAPHYIAIESQRLKIIDYEEIIGPYRLMISKLNQKSRVSEENIYAKGWYDLIEETLPLWRDELNEAIVEKKCLVQYGIKFFLNGRSCST